ncbi:hypothetical protein M422DRAFT_51954 [Sphaerobolus stellatus SS14]|uniref:Uncharacterized protein n=1 Tax=Sphaerobolus stellatus (strain SS14) TaxID=990650 RepID=A0A0C9UI64_SPHS4|nr:hypothetical protein M422DRAFT_51954 [Sphaerobolus stellatus SS14]
MGEDPDLKETVIISDISYILDRVDNLRNDQVVNTGDLIWRLQDMWRHNVQEHSLSDKGIRTYEEEEYDSVPRMSDWEIDILIFRGICGIARHIPRTRDGFGYYLFLKPITHISCSFHEMGTIK